MKKDSVVAPNEDTGKRPMNYFDNFTSFNDLSALCYSDMCQETGIVLPGQSDNYLIISCSVKGFGTGEMFSADPIPRKQNSRTEEHRTESSRSQPPHAGGQRYRLHVAFTCKVL